MGCSCDWQRTRFTLDEVCARAVRETFFALFNEGKIYRGKRLVNWDTFLQTAVSDDEVFHEAVKGHFWHFPVSGRQSQARRTDARDHRHHAAGNHAGRHGRGGASRTRPARLARRKTNCASGWPTPRPRKSPTFQAQLDDVERRRREMLPSTGKAARHGPPRHVVGVAAYRPADSANWPTNGRSPSLGSGCVKITPAHDQNDYDVWQRISKSARSTSSTPTARSTATCPKSIAA